MSQEFSNLSQRCALPKHQTGKAMAELVSPLSRRIDPGPCQGVLDHRADGTLALEADYRCLRTQKHASTGGTRPPVSHVLSDSFANIHG